MLVMSRFQIVGFVCCMSVTVVCSHNLNLLAYYLTGVAVLFFVWNRLGSDCGATTGNVYNKSKSKLSETRI